MDRFAALATTYTFQPFKGALARMQAQRPVGQDDGIARATAAAQKHLGWLSKHLHLVSGGLLHDLVCLRTIVPADEDPFVPTPRPYAVWRSQNFGACVCAGRSATRRGIRRMHDSSLNVQTHPGM